MIFLRSLLFNLAFYGFTALLAIFCLPLLFMGRKPLQWVGRSWAKGTLWLVRVICGIHYEVRGSNQLARQPIIFASKHQSAWDTLIFWALLNDPVYVLKKELLKLPLYGWYLRQLDSIVVDRKGGSASLKKMLVHTAKALEEGRSVILFPEGTRTNVAAAPNYQSGIAAVYSQLGRPVLPVALNSGQHWGKNAFFKRPGTIVISFLPAIEPGMKGRAFMEALTSAIEAESARLYVEDAVR